MKYSRILSFAALLVLCITKNAEPQPFDETGIAVFGGGNFDRFMDDLAGRDLFSGVILISHGGEVVFERAYGMANRIENIPNTTGTKFDIASAGKMFTGLLISKLAEEGKLSFDDTIDKYIQGTREFPGFPAETGRNVTIKQLLTHTSGMGDFMGPAYFNNTGRSMDVPDIMRLIVNQPLRFQPGTRHLYSNSGYVVLGAIIESITGLDYFTCVADYITKPLGMENTGFYEKNSSLSIAHGYIPAGGRFEDTTDRQPLRGSPSGGIYSTAPDLLKFARALLSYTLLNEQNTINMMTGKADTPMGKYAYGFEELAEEGIKTLGHSGGSPGINACLRILPDNDYIVIILSNYDRGIQRPYEEILKTISK
jgi:CubicO group peptidase (beta-lactamase class C family)